MKVHMSPTLKSLLDSFSTDFDTEVGGYLTGEIRNGDIYLDNLLIPNQSQSASHVRITPQDQIELLKRYGNKQVQRIIGHWHSHHSMGCFWSTTDEENMEQIMENKKLYVFIVSSLGNHLIRVSLRDPINIDLDNIPFNVWSLKIHLLRSRISNIINNNSERKQDEEDKQLEDEYKKEWEE